MRLRSPDNNGVCWRISNYLASQRPSAPRCETLLFRGEQPSPAAPTPPAAHVLLREGSGGEAGPPGGAARGSWGLRPAAPGELGRFPPDARGRPLESGAVADGGRELQGAERCRGGSRRCAAWPGHGRLHGQEVSGWAPRPGLSVRGSLGQATLLPAAGRQVPFSGSAEKFIRLQRGNRRTVPALTVRKRPLALGARCCPRAPAWGGGSFVLKNLL